jgi:predicted NBD/HSP70 family sugar kinase
MMLEFNPDAYCLCGVDMGPYWINYILTDLQGKVLAFRHTRETLEDFQTTLDLLSEQIPRFLKENGIPREKVLGVGVGMPGLIDGSQDKIYTTFRKGWTERNFPTELEKRLGIRVEVENNVRARAIGSELFDRSASESILAYFFVSYGVACQLIIEGKVLYGQFAAAGEIGHTVVARGGPVCPTCGNRGCLEALAGERAVLEYCRKLWASGQPTALRQMCQNPEELKMEHVLNAQTMGDQAVNLIMEDVIDYLGIALANTINLISPRAVVLEGRILSTPKNQDRMIRTVDQYMFHIHSGLTDFTFLPYDPDRGARAAAAVVVKEFLGRSL